jgi:hypothetical protein
VRLLMVLLQHSTRKSFDIPAVTGHGFEAQNCTKQNGADTVKFHVTVQLFIVSGVFQNQR